MSQSGTSRKRPSPNPTMNLSVGGKRRTTLDEQIKSDEAGKVVSSRSVARERSAKREARRHAEEESEGLPLGRGEGDRVMRLAREQLVEHELGESEEEEDTKAAFASRKAAFAEDEEEDEEEDRDEFDRQEFGSDVDDDDDGEGEGGYEQMDISEADERALEAFMAARSAESSGTGNAPRRLLSDIISEKLSKRHEEDDDMDEGAAVDEEVPLAPKVIEVYTSVGTLLSRYRSGKVPKAFKLIPALRDWERVLELTNPAGWSPQALRVATRLFASNLNPKLATRFYSNVLLPSIREDIQANKVLNYHRYMALKKSIYKPIAFFKGILLPLCVEGDCTLREAAIVGSVLAKVSIPVTHAGAAMMKIASMPYSGATSLFLRVLINKKYSLAFRVVDSLVDHFCSFTHETQELPVLWHQSLLVFAQRYKTVITPAQRERLRILLRNQQHKQMTAEIRRELFDSVPMAKAPKSGGSAMEVL